MTAPKPDSAESSPRKPADEIPPALAASLEYEVLRELNRGGMGVVYLVRNRRLDRLEALKVVRQDVLKHAGALDRFEREIRSAARLNHPHIVSAYSSPPLDGLLAFAMEFVEGTDLDQFVSTRGPLPVSNACYYIHQAALGLQHAADRNMVHRDIKPSNLILTRDGKRQVIKVLDFGLAKATSEYPIDGGLTGEGQVLGTPLYMAPEQIRSAATADIRADIYSLGCTLYFLLTGTAPFPDKTSLYQILQAHQKESPRPVNEVRPDVPAELVAILSKMMAKDPAERYQRPSEIAQALGPFFKPGVKPVRGEDLAEARNTANLSGSKTIGQSMAAVAAGWKKARRFLTKFEPRVILALAGLALVVVGGLALWAGGLVGGGATRGTEQDAGADGNGKGTAASTGSGTGEQPGKNSAPVHFGSLFNGQDLSGWKVTREDYQSWRVENGEIVVSCADAKSASVLHTEKRYSNYRLRLEYKVDPGARCKFVPRFAEVPAAGEGEQIQAGMMLLDDEFFASERGAQSRGPRRTGFFWVTRGITNNVPVDQPAEIHPAGTWNHLEIEVAAQLVSCTLNGQPILRAHLDELAARENAVAGLRQTHARVGLAGWTGTVRFRSIEIAELPPTAPERRAPPAGGFSPLFNGSDLTGWKAVDKGKQGPNTRWRASNGVIAASAPEGDKQPPQFLASEREYTDYVVRFEFRKTRVPTAGRFVYRAAGQNRSAVVLVDDTQPDSTASGAVHYPSGKSRYPLDYAPLKGVDEWNQAEVQVRDGLLRVVINGVEVQNAPLRAGEKSDEDASNHRKPTRLGFTVRKGEMEVRRIEIGHDG